MEDKVKYDVEAIEATESSFRVDQIASPGNEWFLIHSLEDDGQSIYPVVVWAINNGEVIGLISVSTREDAW